MAEAAAMILNGSIIDGVVLTGVADLRVEVPRHIHCVFFPIHKMPLSFFACICHTLTHRRYAHVRTSAHITVVKWILHDM